MKKNLVKTVIVVAVATSSIAVYGKNLSSTKMSEDFCHCLFSPAKAGEKTVNQKQYTQVFALQTIRNLELYHRQLQWINPDHKMPKKMNWVQAIRTHSNYIGELQTIPSVDERMGRLNCSRAPFYLFQLENEDENNYYIAHANGVRHFCIKLNLANAASMDNGGLRNYPTLNRTIGCTIAI